MIGVGARYTKLHRPKRIVYAEEFDTIREAMKREREIKRLSHDEKEKLLKRAHKRFNQYFKLMDRQERRVKGA
jgi:putative endonuclease